jgi:class 3 adenylate cyclase
MVLFIIPFGYVLSFIENAESYSLAKPILFYDQKLSFCANLIFPEAIKGYNFTPLFLIITALFSLKFVREISSRASNYAKYFTIKETINEMHLPGNIGDASGLNEKLASLKHTGQIDGKQSRDELLKVLGEVQRNLDSMKRDLAFLAIDVVDSTGMKVGEETSNVELDFMEYKKLVEKAFRENGYLKAAWTPDGVMACFSTPNAAVKAAKQVIRNLKIFNRDTKVINRDFTVRCGVNAGKVAFDDNMPMEEMSDRVIDIAGHFQKDAPPGSVCVSKVVYNDLFDSSGFKAGNIEIDGLDTYVSK